MNREKALEIGQELLAFLRPGCERIEIAGSVRRGKGEVKDLELVAIPRVEFVQERDMFGPVPGKFFELNRLEQLIGHGLPQGWAFHKNGPRYKKLVHFCQGLAVDLFLANRRNWGGAMAIRTGPAEFSTALVMVARLRGMQVSGGYYVHHHPTQFDGDGRPIPCPAGDECVGILPTPEEMDFFRVLGVEWLEPGERRPGVGIG